MNPIILRHDLNQGINVGLLDGGYALGSQDGQDTRERRCGVQMRRHKMDGGLI